MRPALVKLCHEGVRLQVWAGSAEKLCVPLLLNLAYFPSQSISIGRVIEGQVSVRAYLSSLPLRRIVSSWFGWHPLQAGGAALETT